MAPNPNNIHHAPVAMVIDAKKAPNINDPTSPINNLAGCQLNNKNIPKVYSNPPSFNEPEPEPVSQPIVTEPHPNIGYTVNIRRRPSHEYTSTTEKVLTPISEKSDSEHELDIKITVTETDARCELDSDDNWEILDSKND